MMRFGLQNKSNLSTEEQFWFEDQLEQGEVRVCGIEFYYGNCDPYYDGVSKEFIGIINAIQQANLMDYVFYNEDEDNPGASWVFSKSIAVKNEMDLLSIYRIKNECISKVRQFYIPIKVYLKVVCKTSESPNSKEYLLYEQHPAIRLGGVNSVLIKGKIDTFDGINIASIEPKYRSRLIRKIVNTIENHCPKLSDFSYEVVEDGVIVAWIDDYCSSPFSDYIVDLQVDQYFG